jgi:hypothetical protein
MPLGASGIIHMPCPTCAIFRVKPAEYAEDV